MKIFLISSCACVAAVADIPQDDEGGLLQIQSLEQEEQQLGIEQEMSKVGLRMSVDCGEPIKYSSFGFIGGNQPSGGGWNNFGTSASLNYIPREECFEKCRTWPNGECKAVDVDEVNGPAGTVRCNIRSCDPMSDATCRGAILGQTSKWQIYSVPPVCTCGNPVKYPTNGFIGGNQPSGGGWNNFGTSATLNYIPREECFEKCRTWPNGECKAVDVDEVNGPAGTVRCNIRSCDPRTDATCRGAILGQTSKWQIYSVLPACTCGDHWIKYPTTGYIGGNQPAGGGWGSFGTTANQHYIPREDCFEKCRNWPNGECKAVDVDETNGPEGTVRCNIRSCDPRIDTACQGDIAGQTSAWQIYSVLPPCATTAPTGPPHTSGDCPVADRVNDFDECQDAAVELGDPDVVPLKNEPNKPPGCIVKLSTTNVIFNTHTGGPEKPNWKHVCRAPATAPVPPPAPPPPPPPPPPQTPAPPPPAPVCKGSEPLTNPVSDGNYSCDCQNNWITGSPGWNLMDLTDSCSSSGGCAANPVYGAPNDNDEALNYCKGQCIAKGAACTAFIFQKHNNGHEICAFTGTSDTSGRSWGGHKSGALCDKTR